MHEDFARRFAATRAASDLGEELEGPFAGAEVGQVKGEIGVDDSDKRDIREM